MASERVEALRALVGENPDDPLGHYLLGLELSKLSRHDEAVRAFRRAVDLDPLYTAAWRELGKALGRAGDVPGARGALARAVEVAEVTGDLQTRREAEVFLRRLGEG
jgi:Flp pilus assembly protein TadD